MVVGCRLLFVVCWLSVVSYFVLLVGYVFDCSCRRGCCFFLFVCLFVCLLVCLFDCCLLLLLLVVVWLVALLVGCLVGWLLDWLVG